MKTKNTIDLIQTNGIVTNGEESLEVTSLSKDHVQSAAHYSREEAMSLVDFYYKIQKMRVASSNKESAHNRNVDILEDPILITVLKEQLHKVEKQAERGLTVYAKNNPLGQWALQQAGIGPVICAGLLAHINFHRCCCEEWRGTKQWDIPKHDCKGLTTAGAIWKFAGLLPPEKQPWNKGEKRPWNAALKTLCWKVGESLKKCSPSEKKKAMTDEELADILVEEAKQKGKEIAIRDVPRMVQEKRMQLETRTERMTGEEYLYVRLYLNRKRQEYDRNERGLFREQALARMANAKKKGFMISPEQKALWTSGKLQPIGIERRAARYAVCIFLSHFHQVGREIFFGDMVKPWIITHGGHTDWIPPPLWPMKEVKRKGT